ncbi:membrane or secreted protein [Pedobacter psychroterrae]|uniref:Membrane or secreted protein n=1 Tax=Pedobacter psychroterrae TaxID=2530453 RepID=A0A4R0NAY4_9SPHI|nr:membrane or secreted protein [Pedobacter psychroterrae]TCC97410.1 membrane or secreted protein [Pedobacter psychroterrae]
MKTFIAFLLITFSAFAVKAQNKSVTGAWILEDGENRHHLFFQDGFFFHTAQQGKQFGMSRGGSYEIKAESISAKIMYNSADSNDVGQVMNIPFSLDDQSLTVTVSDGNASFVRVDNGNAPLAGVWRITGRMGEDGKVADIHQTGSRQTYKMLTGTKFQWVAIDPEKKQFSGTGGGSYTFKDGKYTENIEFFSRDNTRVGASLAFDGKLEAGKWHHSGLSSKGAKIYEVWSKVK